MDGGGELVGMIQVDPADAHLFRQALLLAIACLPVDAYLRPDFARLYVQLGGNPENVK